jgi:hypothetical protein
VTLRASLAVLMFTLATTVADAQSPILLDTEDVYFQYRPAVKHAPDAVGLCGFTIRGNHYSRKNPHVEWDLNIDELTSGDTRIAGISAGTFDVVGRERKGRAPIVEMIFSIAGEPEPIPARIVGPPNQDNAIRAVLEMQSAGKVFTAFSESKLITINLKYGDATADMLQVRGWHDWNRMGPNSNFALCLKGYTPVLRNPVMVK